MILDVVLVLFFVLALLLGYTKGIIVSFFNLAFVALYIFVVFKFLDPTLKLINNKQLISGFNDNYQVKFIVIILVGMILLLLFNFIFLRKFVQRKVISIFDRVGGMIIYGFGAYIAICFLVMLLSSILPFLGMQNLMQDSFAFSPDFNKYNLVYWLWNQNNQNVS